MFMKAALVAALGTLLSTAPALAHHGHNHHGQGHRHDAAGNLVIQSPGHCKHHPHGCGSTSAAVSASEPLVLALTGVGLLGAAARRRLKN